ncbi:PD-(D/E)XK nuclease-like domain-containing protein [Thorsellia anophelis]|uniref:Exodeoxyribonuclease VIII n=1 Tax=Thorsellia anophelis DSM 18579 TaxID=1123402 RepID=A0A1I0CC59_9GAMM|nr:PD-(D/E)XK nuclease-like domain-containing protein [Thorsellia anophelis]SET16706.1 exodeoxyribonuclease VIII [Thorsellia anophelis DSM 18579]
MTIGIFDNMLNEEYQRSQGVSKSQLDLIACSPNTFLWNKKAPVDTSKLNALNMGSALHCLLLEPEEFSKRFIFAPTVNRRTKEGREIEANFLKKQEKSGVTIMTNEEHQKLMLLRESVFAHPAAKKLLELEGYAERSIYWNDKETGELCRSRFDKQLKDYPIIVDIKKTAQIDKFSSLIHDYRYHVQEAMYKDGFFNHFGEPAQFLFIVVSETINCGKYPVRIFELDADYSAVGHKLFRKNLELYHQCKTTNDWGFSEIITAPKWIKNKEEIA